MLSYIDTPLSKKTSDAERHIEVWIFSEDKSLPIRKLQELPSYKEAVEWADRLPRPGDGNTFQLVEGGQFLPRKAWAWEMAKSLKAEKLLVCVTCNTVRLINKSETRSIICPQCGGRLSGETGTAVAKAESDEKFPLIDRLHLTGAVKQARRQAALLIKPGDREAEAKFEEAMKLTGDENNRENYERALSLFNEIIRGGPFKASPAKPDASPLDDDDLWMRRSATDSMGKAETPEDYNPGIQVGDFVTLNTELLRESFYCQMLICW